MKLEDQVCSIELGKRFKELGVQQDSLFYYIETSYRASDTARDRHHNQHRKKLIYKPGGWSEKETPPSKFWSIYTVAELGEMLSKESNSVMFANNKWASVIEQLLQLTLSRTEADARAKMLIYLLENKLIKLRPK